MKSSLSLIHHVHMLRSTNQFSLKRSALKCIEQLNATIYTVGEIIMGFSGSLPPCPYPPYVAAAFPMLPTFSKCLATFFLYYGIELVLNMP
jgi:hypothetical protein